MRLIPSIKKLIFLILGLGILILCLIFGRNVPFSDQWLLYEGLRNTAAIIFGVMGAWLAIVYPEALSHIIERNNLSAAKNYKKLIDPLLYSTVTLIWILLLGIIAPILKQISFFLIHTNSLRSISFLILVFLTLLQSWALLLTLLPADMTKRKIDRESNSVKVQDRWKSRNQKDK